MADDSLDVEQSMDFHSCDAPHHMRDYILEDLTGDQQTQLNKLKVDTARQDQKYLQKHPEIRAITFLICKQLMGTRPKTNIHKHIGRYFARPKIDIQEEIDAYLGHRKDILAEKKICLLRQSHYNMKIDAKDQSGDESEDIVKEVIDDILEQTVAIGTVAHEVADDIIVELQNRVFEIIDAPRTDWLICKAIVNDLINNVLAECETHRKQIAQDAAERDIEEHPYKVKLDESVMESFGFTVTPVVKEFSFPGMNIAEPLDDEDDELPLPFRSMSVLRTGKSRTNIEKRHSHGSHGRIFDHS